MSVPQIKEGPASMLRAMFASFGSLMSVVDKVRAKPAAEAPADAEAPAAATAQAPEKTAAPQSTAASETTAEAQTSSAAETVAAEPAAEPETPAAPQATVEPQTIAEPETSAAPAAVAVAPAAEPETSAAFEASGALPLANYDDLSVASLRARLRNLSNDDLTLLMTYEKGHQNRPEVIKMFQNRLIKMTTGLPKLEA
jgi:cytoskeletal protein RodZ